MEENKYLKLIKKEERFYDDNDKVEMMQSPIVIVQVILMRIIKEFSAKAVIYQQ